jgi:hypothetical protein
MPANKEITSLAAETLALQAILTHILGRICQADDRLASAVRGGFDEAASEIEDLAIKFGRTASADHVAKALGIVETLRAATLGEPDQPKHAI